MLTIALVIKKRDKKKKIGVVSKRFWNKKKNKNKKQALWERN